MRDQRKEGRREKEYGEARVGRQKTGDERCETKDERQETGDRRQETGVGI